MKSYRITGPKLPGRSLSPRARRARSVIEFVLAVALGCLLASLVGLAFLFRTG